MSIKVSLATMCAGKLMDKLRCEWVFFSLRRIMSRKRTCAREHVWHSLCGQLYHEKLFVDEAATLEGDVVNASAPSAD